MTSILRPHPVTVRVGDIVDVTIPALMADAWVEALSADDPVRAVIPGLVDGGGEDLSLAMVQRRITADHLVKAAHEAMAQAGADVWWVVMRLAVTSVKPSVYGALILASARPAELTFPGWLACVYSILSRNLEEKERTKLDFDLQMPPAGMGPDDAVGFDTVEW